MSEFKDFYYPSSTGKNIIHACICIPCGEPRGIVQIAHGITEHIGNYKSFMAFLADNGFIAVGNDHLGHGLSVTDPDDLGFFCEKNGWDHAVSDIFRLHKIVDAKFPGLPHFWFGFSMGSFLMRTCLIKYPGCCDAALICGTGHQHGAKLMAGIRLTQTLAEKKGPRYISSGVSKLVFGSYNNRIPDKKTAFDWLTRDEKSVESYISDPLCGFVPTVSLFGDMLRGIAYITDPKNTALMDKNTPVIFMSGCEDPVGDYGKGVLNAYSSFHKAGMKEVSIRLYSGARHGLLSELNKEEFMHNVLDYINNVIKQKEA